MKLREKTQVTLLLCMIVCVVKVQSDVSTVQVGHDAVLHCHLSIENFSLITWKVYSQNQAFCLLSTIGHNPLGNCSHRIHLDIDKNKTYLRIQNSEILDDGEYKCEVVNKSGTFMYTVVLQVLAKPFVLLETNENGHPECRAIGGKPAANILWVPEPTSDVTTQTNMENNGTTTVISSYNTTNITDVTCIVSHPTFARPVEIRPSALAMVDAGANDLVLILGVISVLVLLLGIVLFWKRSTLRSCLMKKDNSSTQENPTITDIEEEVEPYASFTVKVNTIYDAAYDFAECKEENKARWKT